MKEYIRLEYKDCFSERPDAIIHYLNGISKELLLKLCNLFLARKQETAKSFFLNYFKEENNEFVNDLWKKLCSKKK